MRHLTAPLFVFNSARANHHPRRSIVEQSLNLCILTHPTANLYRHARLTQQIANDLGVRTTVGRGVEVNHMQPREANA